MKKIALITIITALLLPALFIGNKAFPEQGDGKEIQLSTTRAASKIKVIVPDFIKEGGFSDPEKRDAVLADIIADDLNFSGYFDAKRVKEVKGDPTAWASLEVDDVAQGSYSTDGREIHIEIKVVDANNGSFVFDKKYPNALRVLRQTAHRISDDIISQLAGEKGISQTKIAFVSDMTGHNELYLSDYDGHNAFRMTRDEGTCLLPAWSPSGNYLTYTSYKRMNPDLWWVSASAKSRGIISFSSGLNAAASWAPDGETIALSLSKDGNAEIYTMKRDGTGLKRLTFDPGIDTSPSWSPNGREIVFNSGRSGNPQLYIMSADGGNVRRLTFQGKYNASPSWSPNGGKVAYVSREGNLFNIFLIDITGENIVRLTWNAGNNENPSWSPDGRHIVFSSTRDGGRKALYTMDPNGENVRRLNIAGNVQTPAWSPRVAQ